MPWYGIIYLLGLINNYQILQIYLHEEGSEYWLQFFLFPRDVTITEIDAVGKIGYTVVKLKYLIDEKINRKQYRCDPTTTMKSFTKCAFQELSNNGKSIIYKILIGYPKMASSNKPSKIILYELVIITLLYKLSFPNFQYFFNQ